MTRICTSLALHNYRVVLVGKYYPVSLPLLNKTFSQHRIRCLFKKGKLAYIEFNLKLFFFLLFRKAEGLCAIDLDTIFPVLAVSVIKKCKRIYDAHELFTEMKEVISRPFIHAIWSWVEKTTIPHFSEGYTVNDSLASYFNEKYGVNYRVIRNMPPRKNDVAAVPLTEKFIIYQGSVNFGRCMENLIPAMKKVNARLLICGDGNFMNQSRQLVIQHQLSEKVIFKGQLLPEDLQQVTATSYIGVNLVEPEGLNQIYSLANKFFDYIHAGLPQLTMDFIEYARINKVFKVALLIPDPSSDKIASALNLLLDNNVLYKELRENCIKAREIYNWQKEEQMLLGFYDKIFN